MGVGLDQRRRERAQMELDFSKARRFPDESWSGR
jgi:hypothetical protein